MCPVEFLLGPPGTQGIPIPALSLSSTSHRSRTKGCAVFRRLTEQVVLRGLDRKASNDLGFEREYPLARPTDVDFAAEGDGRSAVWRRW